MEHLGSTLAVFAILLVVAIAALSFEPANPLAAWLKLAERYATQRRPSSVDFPEQKLLFGVGKGRVKALTDFARFDATIDDFGLWIVFRNNPSEELVTTLKIPGTHIRFQGQHGQQQMFQLYAEPPVRLAARGEFGEALMRQCEGSS